jgi:hypothetical protein
VDEKPYSFTLNIAAVNSDMLVHFNQIAQPHIPEDNNLKVLFSLKSKFAKYVLQHFRIQK